MSKLEDTVEHTLRRLYTNTGGKSRYERNYRPDWLLYENGRSLELDFFIPSISIGVEVQGEQHLEFSPFFHASPDDFEKQKQRDTWKKETCRRRGVLIVEVFTKDDIVLLMNLVVEREADTSWLKGLPGAGRLRLLVSEKDNIAAREHEIVGQLKKISRQRDAYYIWINALNLRREMLVREARELEESRKKAMLEGRAAFAVEGEGAVASFFKEETAVRKAKTLVKNLLGAVLPEPPRREKTIKTILTAFSSEIKSGTFHAAFPQVVANTSHLGFDEFMAIVSSR